MTRGPGCDRRRGDRGAFLDGRALGGVSAKRHATAAHDARIAAHSPVPDEACDGALWSCRRGSSSHPNEALRVWRTRRSASCTRSLASRFRRVASRARPSTFRPPGFVAERHFFLRGGSRSEYARRPALDGSALEHFGVVVEVGLELALAMCRSGAIEDSKTELTCGASRALSHEPSAHQRRRQAHRVPSLRREKTTRARETC